MNKRSSPIFLFSEIFIILNRHVLFHVEFWEDLGDDNLITLGSIEVEVAGVYLPSLILLDLLIEVIDGMSDVDLVRNWDLVKDSLCIFFQRLEICILSDGR